MKIKEFEKKIDLNSILNEVLKIVDMAGRKLVYRQRKLGSLQVSIKRAQGLVSNADIESEEFLIKKLKTIIPKAEFLAEESAFAQFGNKKKAYLSFKEKEFVWIIDPLDGTSNFLSGLDYYGICVCLAYYGKPLLGVVYRPSLEEAYYAVSEKGAFYKKSQSRAKRLDIKQSRGGLKKHLLVTGFACEKGEVFEKEFSTFRKVMESCRGVRRFGSAALDMCLVSQGIFGGFWERGLAPWDVAASSLILEEAGGVITDYNGQAFNPFQETIVAANKSVHKSLRKLLET